LTGVVLGAIWYYVVVPRQTRPILRYLRQACEAGGRTLECCTPPC